MSHNSLDVSRETSQKIGNFINILLLWNQKFNLISKNTEKDILERHVMDSLQLSKFISLDDNILDFGTGAGFPGIILNIAGYNNITLVESIRKKCVFLENVKTELDLSATIINDRIEKTPSLNPNVITARAVAPLDKLLEFANFHYKQDTKLLFLKGKNYREEIKNAEKLWKFNYKTYTSSTSDESVILKITDLKWK